MAKTATQSNQAERIASELISIADQYHFGRVDAAYWHDRNVELWGQAERLGIDADVKRMLRS